MSRSGGRSTEMGVAERLLRCVVARRADEAVELVTEDFVHQVVGSQTYRGRSGLRDLVADHALVYDTAEVVVRQALTVADLTAFELTYTVVIRGGVLEIQAASFVRTRGGLVENWRTYQDLREISRVIDGL